jgi:hypothetical protein
MESICDYMFQHITIMLRVENIGSLVGTWLGGRVSVIEISI